jgi:hypothetical protein
MHHFLDGSAELPAAIGGVIVMGRDEDLEPIGLGSLEEPLDVLDGLVLLHAVTNQLPGDALLTEEVVLRVGNQHCCILLVNLHGFPPFSGSINISPIFILLLF